MNKNQLMIAVCNWLAEIDDNEKFDIKKTHYTLDIKVKSDKEPHWSEGLSDHDLCVMYETC